MWEVIRSFFITILLGFFTVASAQLPPEIMVDKHLLQADVLLEKKDYGGAFKEMKKIVALQKEHNLTLSDAFLFKYAKVALKVGEYQTTIDAVNKYLVTAGKKGEFYKEALALLNEAEQMLPLEPEMVVIPAGSFWMGCVSGIDCSNAYKPVHEVKIDSFALSKYEVTFEEYDRFTDATGRAQAADAGWGRGRRPVINVSWYDAVAYAAWLSDQTGKTYRLPSEAEWEYAARAGTMTQYSWGNDIGTNRANCAGCGSQWDRTKTAPVGSFEANGWGLHDMQGNVWEWVRDCWNDNYEGAPADGSAWLSGDCSRHVRRGGSWNNEPWFLRSANRGRYGYTPRDRFYTYGFRIVRSF